MIERRSALLAWLQSDGRVEVAAAALRFDTAEMTIRRDLDVLVARGVARRVRGGAVNLLMRGEELPFAMRAIEATDSKRRIAAAVAERVEGKVRLYGVIRKDGHVDSIALIQHVDVRLDQSAAGALGQWVFEPALRNGRPVEVVGTYNPRTNPASVELKRDRVEYWVSKGAQMSERVNKLFTKTPAPATASVA